MTHHRFTITYRTRAGDRRREVFFADMNGLRWFRRVDVEEDGRWVRRDHEEITAPTIEAKSVGSGSFAGS